MKPTRPDIILWDWDNTLVNTRPMAFQALKDLALENDRPVPTNQDITDVMGTYQGRYWHEHYPDELLPKIRRYLDLYQSHASLLQPFPETKEVLSWVRYRGIPQIVVSNKNQPIIEQEAARLNLAPYFDKIVGTNLSGPAKPSKAFADRVFGSVWPKSVWMIGDGESDMQFATTLGAFGLLVRTGHEPLPFSYDKRVQSMNEVLDFLKKHLP